MQGPAGGRRGGRCRAGENALVWRRAAHRLGDVLLLLLLLLLLMMMIMIIIIITSIIMIVMITI